ncbi:SctD/MshK family protein [Inquilinus sp. OTU3971]|uniref:SctD/MshK family protein n=1 Tax=Inquilinus sp. OTU3971 TaxID=3043855 RepID=UPI00313E8466
MLCKLIPSLSKVGIAVTSGRWQPSSPEVTLFVIEGPNAGTVQKLALAAHRVGSGLDSDIVLADRALASVHTLIDLRQRSVRIEPLAGDVTTPGYIEAVKPGDSLTLPLPAELVLGASRVLLRRAKEIDGNRGHLRQVAVILLAMVVLGGLLGILLSPSRPERIDTMSQTAAIASRSGVETPVASRAMSTSVAAPEDSPQEILQARIEQAGLYGVTLHSKGDRIIASGRLSPSDMVRWREVQAWFDRTFASSALLASEVATGMAASAPEIIIQAVWTGDSPYLITHTGSKYFEGADLGGGWSVDTIRADAVTLRSRAGQAMTLTLTEPAKIPAKTRDGVLAQGALR